MTLADLYSIARNPANSSHSLGSQLPPLPQRVKGHPTPYLTRDEIEILLAPLCARSEWNVKFRLPSNSEQDRTAVSDCGCAPNDLPSQVCRSRSGTRLTSKPSFQGELPFLINTYHFSSIQTADDFLADVKLLSDVGEFVSNHSFLSLTSLS